MNINFIKCYIITPLIFLIVNCTGNDSTYSVEVTNPLDAERIDEFVIINFDQLKITQAQHVNNLTVKNGETFIPCQLTDTDNDGTIDGVAVVLNFKPGESILLEINLNYPEKSKDDFIKRAYAEIAIKKSAEFKEGKYIGGNYENINNVKVPYNHIDHDNLFKYEGPGWESDKVGYRFYLDWRNAVDIFGKKTTDMVLKNVGVQSLDQISQASYHTMSDWGADILKVGNSLGIGSVGMLDKGKVIMVSKTDSITCAVAENGIIKSDIRTRYYGWEVGNKKYNIQTDFSITAGSRLTFTEIQIDNEADNILTGIVKLENAHLIKQESLIENDWSYIATFGEQTLFNDNLGMVIFYKYSELLEITEDEYSYIIVLKARNQKASYYFGAAWEKEKNGITGEKDFISYLNETIQKLNNPIKLNYK